MAPALHCLHSEWRWIVRFIRTRQVLEMIGVGRTTLWKMVQEGTFPRPLRITERNSGYLLEAVEEWMQLRTQGGCPGNPRAAGGPHARDPLGGPARSRCPPRPQRARRLLEAPVRVRDDSQDQWRTTASTNAVGIAS